MLKISVITAVFNRVHTVAQALDSVAAQSWPAVEHVVIDGGSTDGTLALLQARQSRLAVLVSEPDRGIYDALNKGLARASGEVLGFLHSDDYYASDEVLARVAEAFADPAVDAVYGDLDYVSADGQRVIRRWRSGQVTPARLRRGWMPPHPTLYLRRRVIEQWGGFDTGYRIAADYDAILRYFVKGGIRVKYLPMVMVKMRVGGVSNAGLRRLWQKSSEDWRALRANGLGGLGGAGALAWKNLSKLGQFL